MGARDCKTETLVRGSRATTGGSEVSGALVTQQLVIRQLVIQQLGWEVFRSIRTLTMESPR